MADLNLADKLLLLALDDDKGTFTAQPFALTYGMAGSILLELSLQEHIKIVDKKVVANTMSRINDSLLDKYLDVIRNSKKERSLKYWVQKLGSKQRSIKNGILDKLIASGILVKKEKKVLWVFNNDVFPTVNSKPENSLRNQLYNVIEGNKTSDLDELMLISLIDTCNLNRTVYGKERAKACKANIKKVISDAKNSQIINATVKEVHDIILAMLVVVISSSIVATTAATN